MTHNELPEGYKPTNTVEVIAGAGRKYEQTRSIPHEEIYDGRVARDKRNYPVTSLEDKLLEDLLREQIAKEIELHICEMPHSTKELENICHWERDGFIYAAKIARGGVPPTGLPPARLPDGHKPVSTETRRSY